MPKLTKKIKNTLIYVFLLKHVNAHLPFMLFVSNAAIWFIYLFAVGGAVSSLVGTFPPELITPYHFHPCPYTEGPARRV